MRQCLPEVMDIIRIENLSFTYPPDKAALTDISFSIPEGDFFIISGPNGCGKTTLLKCIKGLLRPVKGKIYFKGDNTRIGYSFQDPNDQLFCATVRQDIAYGPVNMGLSREETESRVDEALELLDIKSIGDKSIHDLSHGSKQRVALAGILAMRPEVLLLDEPTASLDPQTEDEILAFLRKLNREKGLTIVMATHEMDIIPECARHVAILSDGALVRQGGLDEIFGCDECLRKGRLRLPIVTLLVKSLNLDCGKLPLTFNDAKECLKKRLI